MKWLLYSRQSKGFVKGPKEGCSRAFDAKKFVSKEEAEKFHKEAEIPEHFKPMTEKDYAEHLIDILYPEDSPDQMTRQCRWAALSLHMNTDGSTMKWRIQEFVMRMNQLSNLYDAGGV